MLKDRGMARDKAERTGGRMKLKFFGSRAPFGEQNFDLWIDNDYHNLRLAHGVSHFMEFLADDPDLDNWPTLKALSPGGSMVEIFAEIKEEAADVRKS